jgi:hypothetical protein
VPSPIPIQFDLPRYGEKVHKVVLPLLFLGTFYGFLPLRKVRETLPDDYREEISFSGDNCSEGEITLYFNLVRVNLP